MHSQDSLITAQEWHDLFQNGVYDENSHQLIPWNAYSGIKSYDNPTVIRKSRNGLHLRWDSAVILHGIKLPLAYSYLFGKCAECGLDQRISVTALGPITVADGKRLQQSLDKYTGRPATPESGTGSSYIIYGWLTDSCYLTLYFHKKRNECHLQIRKEIGGIPYSQ